MVLAIAALALGDAPPEWILGIGAGAGAAVVAVVVQAGISLGRSSLAGRRDLRAPAYIAAGSRRRCSWGRMSCSCCSAAGFLELAWRRRGRVALHAWPFVIAAAAALPGLAWTAFKVGALSYGGGFVVIPLMQEDAVDRHGWMTDGEFLNAVAFGQLTPGPVTHTVALVGWAAAGMGGALLAAAVAFAPSFLAIVLGGERFGRLRENRAARAFLDGAGPAAVGAILGAAVPLAEGARRVVAGGAAGRRGGAARAGPPAAVGARRRRARRAAGRRGRRAAARSATPRRPTTDGPAGRGDRRPRDADPLRHGQPARERARVPGVAEALPRGRRARVRAALRRGPRAPEPRRAPAR